MEPKSLLRKVQLTGGSTYIVSLPKNWVKYVRLKPGDYVRIKIQPDESLLILPKEEEEKINEKSLSTCVDASKASTPEEVAREFIACYLVGYNLINVKFSRRTSWYKTCIKEVMRKKLIGMEVVEESVEQLSARCLVGYTDLSVKDAVNRMYMMAISMHQDAIIALREGDFRLAEEIIDRDDEVDRLYFFVVRQLKMAVENRFMIEKVGLSKAIDCLGYRMVAKNIERIADHATNIAEAITEIRRGQDLSELIDKISYMSKNARESLHEAMLALYQLDIEKSNKSIDKAKESEDAEKEVTKMIFQSQLDVKTSMALRLVLESVRRTSEYSTDIAEIAINLAKKHLQTT